MDDRNVKGALEEMMVRVLTWRNDWFRLVSVRACARECDKRARGTNGGRMEERTQEETNEIEREASCASLGVPITLPKCLEEVVLLQCSVVFEE